LRKEPEDEAEPDDEETEIVEAGKHDDASFLLELYQSIKSHRFRERAEGFVPSLLPSLSLYDVRHHRSVPQLIELVNDRLADLYTLAQSEVLDDVRSLASESMIICDETLSESCDLRDQSGHACFGDHGHFC
jgi:hypothetical protein